MSYVKDEITTENDSNGKMKALQVKSPNIKTLCDFPDPEPVEGWVRVKVRVACICRTDLELLAGTIPARYPVIPGHEWSGIVDKVGSPNDGRWLGRRVTANNEVTCLKCAFCRRGEWRRCGDFRQIGFEIPGAYADYLLVPIYNLCELAEGVSFEQGALLEPLGVGLAAADMAGVRLGTTVLILGAGPIGLSCLAVMKASGARQILCLDRLVHRISLARAWGATVAVQEIGDLQRLSRQLHPHGADVVIDATGSVEMLKSALSLVRFGGSYVLAGYGGNQITSFQPDSIHVRNVRVLGAGNNSGYTGAAVSLANDGLIRTEGMITHRFCLNEAVEALSMAAVSRLGYIKGAFTFPG